MNHQALTVDASLQRMFHDGRSQNGFRDQPVPMELVRQAYDLARMGPTSFNGQPMRLVLLSTPAAKRRILPALLPVNVPKAEAAPIVAIVATDMSFHERLGQLSHSADARDRFEANPGMREDTAIRNATLQGGYLMLTLRAVGLDIGPMSGFDRAAVDREFFADGRLKSNWLINIGYGDPAKVYGRLPRLAFDEIAQIL